MANFEKEYYPYPGSKNYYQITTNPFKNMKKPVHEKTYNTKEIDKIISSVIEKINNSTHVVTETVTFATLPEPSTSNCGVIYNVTDGFISDDRFLDGPGKHYPEGSNVIVISNNGQYKFDVFAGEIGEASEQSIEDLIDDIYKD